MGPAVRGPGEQMMIHLSPAQGAVYKNQFRQCRCLEKPFEKKVKKSDFLPKTSTMGPIPASGKHGRGKRSIDQRLIQQWNSSS
jgi:hypothetical protein